MRILAMFTAGYALAVFAAVLLLPEGAFLPLGGVCVLLALLLAALLRKSRRKYRRYAVLVCAGAAAGLMWSWCYAQLYLVPARALDGRTVVLNATAADFPQETDYGASVLVRVQLERGEVNALLYIDSDYMDLRPGDRLTTVARCCVATHSSQGEEITYYTAKGIFLTATAYGELTFQRPDRVPVRDVPAWLSRGLKRGIDSVFPADVSPVVKALVTGNRDSLTDSYTTSLQRSGLSHVAAVSGMHLAFLAGVISALLGRHRRRTALVLIPTVLAFMVVAGSTPSVVRAVVMVILLQLAPLFGRERDDVTSLAFALLVLLIANPYAAASVGLQLSFAAVAGILLFSGGIQERILDKLKLKPPKRNPIRWLWNKVIQFLVSVFCTTIGALVFTTPLSALYFEKISLIAPLSNLLTLGVVAVVFGGGLFAGVLYASYPALSGVCAAVVTPFVRYLNHIIPWLAKIPFASLPTTAFYYRAWLLLVYGLLIVSLLSPGKNKPALPLAVGAVSLGISVLLTNLAFQAGAMRVEVLDVGQGQSVLIRSGQMLALVDCGGDGYENAGDIAADHIQALGRGTLDLLVISHYHTDHANGVPELLERIDVKEIALPDVEEDSALRQRILAQAEEHGIPVRFIREDTVLPVGEDAVFTLYPPLGEGSTNELGLTVLCSAGDFDVLLTGDMGTSVEELLLAHAALPDVELMVAGHHGSRYANSLPLLETVKPELAVFSVGENNGYGHPAMETVERFVQVGAALYRTDWMGTVTVIVEADLS